MTSDSQSDLSRKNARLLKTVLGVAGFMVLVSFASVPLYDLFCRVTGYGGTTQISEALPDVVLGRQVKVQFDATTARDLPWVFKPVQRDIMINLGGKAVAAYTAHNKSDEPVSGVALYNVVPAKAGKYFHKIECFCFGEMILNPQQTMNMPILFYVDPKMNDDPQMNDVKTITLSYTFYKMESKELEEAQEAFYNQDDVRSDI